MMIKQCPFEIKIALLGHVSVGKTTVLNAILRDKFGEVAMRRTTAAVNYFRLVPPLPELKSPSDESETSSKNEEKQDQSHMDMTWAEACKVMDQRDASSTLKEITEDNVKLRDSDQVHEKFFDIAVSEALCDMRQDTRLVLVDVPGINEAGSGKKYLKYVDQKWETFDCVVLVTDGRQGVNTEEQVELLHFVKKKLDEKRRIPVIILCNKVDDPDDEGQQVVVDEARAKVESVFQVSNRESALISLLTKVGSNRSEMEQNDNDTDIFPVFIRTSAIHAYIYQATPLMSMDQFKKFDNELLDKFGREEFGKLKWRKLSETDRLEMAYTALSDVNQNRERLQATNFDKFCSILRYVIGDHKTQLVHIENQLEISFRMLSATKGMSLELASLYKKSVFLNIPTDRVTEAFWRLYREYEDKVFRSFTKPTDVDMLATLMKELRSYLIFNNEVGLKDQGSITFRAMKNLLRRQISVILNEHHNTSNHNANYNTTGGITWSCLGLDEWKTIFLSVLLMAFNKHFCVNFSHEIILLQSYFNGMTGSGGKFTFKVENDQLVAEDKEKFSQSHRIIVPDSPEHPSHWGHLVYEFCTICELNALSDLFAEISTQPTMFLIP